MILLTNWEIIPDSAMLSFLSAIFCTINVDPIEE